MEIGGPNHEACAGIVALSGYLRGLVAAAAPLLPEQQTQPAACVRDEFSETGQSDDLKGTADDGRGAYTGVGTWSGANANGNAALRLAPLTRVEVEAAYHAIQGGHQRNGHISRCVSVNHSAASPHPTIDLDFNQMTKSTCNAMCSRSLNRNLSPKIKIFDSIQHYSRADWTMHSEFVNANVVERALCGPRLNSMP